MKDKTFDVVSSMLSVVTGAISIDNIYTVLGIITLVLSAVNIAINLAFKIYRAVKNKNYEEISNSINEAVGQFNELGDKKDGKAESSSKQE